jgi:hypothetical protein
MIQQIPRHMTATPIKLWVLKLVAVYIHIFYRVCVYPKTKVIYMVAGMFTALS